MLRYFYLLSLIIYIREAICYDHARSLRLKPKRFDKRLLKLEDSNIVKNNHYHNIKRRQGYAALNENDITQIDVASFIQKPDSYADDDKLLSQSYDFKNKRTPKHFSDEDINNILKDINVKNENLIADKKSKSNHDSDSHRHADYVNYQDLEEPFANTFDKNLIFPSLDSPKKQCHWNYSLKFPFFFHKDNIPLIHMLNNTKKKLRYIIDSGNKYDLPKEINKRANKVTNNLKYNTENVKIKNDKRGLAQSIFHNSRQFYQNLMSNVKKNPNKPMPEKKNKDRNKPEPFTQTYIGQATASTKCHNGDDKKLFKKRKGNIHRKITCKENNIAEGNKKNSVSNN